MKTLASPAFVLAALITLLCTPPPGQAQPYDSTLVQGLEYRMIGPYRGGRVTAVAGVPGQPYTFYMGSVGGGVWKTTSAGEQWTNVSDGDFEVGPVGALAVAPSEPSVVYAGTGSACIRGNISTGRGVYKSADAGETWTFVGLPEAGQIGRILVHPDNPDRVYVAALGHPFGPNEERGVYRSTDGGETWEQVLYVSDQTGAVDLAFNPQAPHKIYAAMWQAERKPWTIRSGGAEGGLFKTSDGGDSWTQLTNGLPEDPVGRIGVAVSPADPERVWTLVEAEQGEGLYRSDDGGKTFQLVNGKREMLMARPWYYTHVEAHPTEPNTVYVLNEDFFKSTDGGADFDVIDTPHGDSHALWINPDHPKIMVEGNDGGANVSVDGGQHWSTQRNQPTAEFYSVAVDDRFPYRVYGPQQDNSTISVPSRGMEGIAPEQHWFAVGGCETGPVELHPEDASIIYAGCYGGRISRYNHDTKQTHQVMVYPQMQHGQPVKRLTYRFNWNSPILISEHAPDRLYHGSQYVLRSTDAGHSWTRLSPDLTRDNEERQGYPGGPITYDISGVETYNTLVALAESPHEAEVLWAGSDDGLLHVTRDDGQSWTDVTPEALPAGSRVNRIEPSPHDPGTAYIAAYHYRYDDYAPYLFRTEDYGQTWTRLTDGTNGLPGDHPTRVVREDPEREGLLYAGTEFGLFVSFDDGARWQPLQLNLPATPVTDLVVHRGDLVVATQGRSFWILDDLSPLRQLTEEVAQADVHLFQPRAAYRMRLGGTGGENVPEPGPRGAIFNYYLADAADEVTIDLLDEEGTLIRSFSSRIDHKEEDGPAVDTTAGAHRLVWDLHYPEADLAEGAEAGGDQDVVWGYTGGPVAVPGPYQVRLSANGQTQTRRFTVKKDPRTEASQADLQAQFDFLKQLRNTLTEAHDAIGRLRAVREQVQHTARHLVAAGHDSSLAVRADTLSRRLTAVEDALLQTEEGDVAKLETAFSSQLAWMASQVYDSDTRPTEGARQRYADLEAQLAEHLETLDALLADEVAGFNERVRQTGAPPVVVP